MKDDDDPLAMEMLISSLTFNIEHSPLNIQHSFFRPPTADPRCRTLLHFRP